MTHKNLILNNIAKLKIAAKIRNGSWDMATAMMNDYGVSISKILNPDQGNIFPYVGRLY